MTKSLDSLDDVHEWIHENSIGSFYCQSINHFVSIIERQNNLHDLDRMLQRNSVIGALYFDDEHEWSMRFPLSVATNTI